jgi:hypothetical protein
MHPRIAVLFTACATLACAACGGGAPRANTADVLAANQPTPDSTLDAVVRDLPRMLAGVPPTATPTPKPVTRQAPTPKPPTPTLAVRKPTATAVRR